MLEGASTHHGSERWAMARNFEEAHARAIANSASSRGTILLSLESVLYPCIPPPHGSAKPNRPFSLLVCAFDPNCRWEASVRANNSWLDRVTYCRTTRWYSWR